MSEPTVDELQPPPLEVLRELIPRYDRPGPRYTSYPTAPIWQESFGPQQQRGWQLDEDDRRRKWPIQALMCRGETDPGAYAERFDEPIEDRVPDLSGALAPFEADGLLVAANGAWRLTFLGRLFLRNVAMTFDAHLTPPAEGAKRYSRTV